MFGCCLVCVLGHFGLFRDCLGAGSGGIGYKSVGMGRLVESRTDLAVESTSLRGKQAKNTPQQSPKTVKTGQQGDPTRRGMAPRSKATHSSAAKMNRQLLDNIRLLDKTGLLDRFWGCALGGIGGDPSGRFVGRFWLSMRSIGLV